MKLKLLKILTEEIYSGGLIQEGDDLCVIICKIKIAANGSNGDTVKEIQHALANCSQNLKNNGGGMSEDCAKNKYSCDGKFGKKTEESVKEYQKNTKLTVDGKVGYDTLQKLKINDHINLPNCKCDEDDKTKKSNEVLSNSSDIIYSSLGSLDLTKLDNSNFSIPKSNGTYGWRGPIPSMIYKNKARYAYTHWHAGRDYSYGRLPVVTLKSGIIERTGNECITIIYEDNSRSRFCHMTDIPKNGEKVSAGQIIGKVGNVGCKAVHLHWEFYPSSGTATKHTIPKTGTKVNLENTKVSYYLNGEKVIKKNKPKPENYNDIYIERYDIDPSGHEKSHVVILKNKASFLSDLAKNKYIITTK